MTHVGRSLTQRKSTPRHAPPARPLRDLTDDEYSELVDTDAEQGYALLHDLPALTGEKGSGPLLVGPGSTSLANPRCATAGVAGGRRDRNEEEAA